MGRFDSAFEDAADEVREELKGKVLELCSTPDKLLSLDVSQEDKQRIEELIREVKASDSANVRKQAFQKFSKSATAAAWRLVKGAAKAMMVLALALLLWRPATAGILDIESPMDYLKQELQLTKAGPAVNFKANLGAVAYLPVYSIHNAKEGKDRRYYADFGIGYSHFELPPEMKAAGIKEDHVVAVAGLNFVELSHMAWRGVFRKYVEVTPLPDLWIGPVIEAPPLDNIKETWVIGYRTSIIFAYKFLGGPAEGEKKP